tara:strand:+ start:946 stop:1230 length:285 start_codon:yes stop_codon:yes gene_type:complete
MEEIISVLGSLELMAWEDSTPRCEALLRMVKWDVLLDTVEVDSNGGVGAFSVVPFEDHDFVVRLVRLAPDRPGLKTWVVIAPGELPARTVNVPS